MTFRYRPVDAAVVGLPWNVTFLSQRDVALTIPIPFVVGPGVSLSAACFPHGRYDDYSAAQCISNLLALGFRRIYLDLYWDSGRQTWSFCPARIPLRSPTKSNHQASRTSSPSSAAAQVASAGAISHKESSAAIQQSRAEKRQHAVSTTGTSLVITAPRSTSISRTTLTVDTSTASDTTVAVLPSSNPSKHLDETLYSIGPYICSATPALRILNGILYDFLERTDNTLAANLKLMLLNIKAAADPLDPTSPAPTLDSDRAPKRSDHLGLLFEQAFGDYLFTPRGLRAQRSDLRNSWFEANPRYRPKPAYYSKVTKQGILTTPDGWPSESIMEFEADNHRRLLLGFGSVDRNLRAYNVSRDEELIFAPGTLDVQQQSCAFDPQELSLSAANNSWSASSISNSIASELAQETAKYSLSSVTSLVRCGNSPILNQTLSSGTAASHILPYKQVAYSSVWSWAPGQPQTREDMRCAILDPSSHGRWRVQDCSSNHRAACRIDRHPYNWTISEKSDEYSDAVSLCPNNTAFDVPRTPLELRYLLNAYRQQATKDPAHDLGAQRKSTLSPIWIDLNCLDVLDCWVSRAGTTCPYNTRVDTAAQIYVPTIAGVVILILAALLVLVKCGFNRRNSRRRRRGSGGWDYEGVPS